MENLKDLLTPFRRVVIKDEDKDACIHIVSPDGEMMINSEGRYYFINNFNDDLSPRSIIDEVTEIYEKAHNPSDVFDFSKKGNLIWKREKPQEKPKQTKDSVLDMVDCSIVSVWRDEDETKAHTTIMIKSKNKKLQDIFTQMMCDVVKCHFDIKSLNVELPTTKQ